MHAIALRTALLLALASAAGAGCARQESGTAGDRSAAGIRASTRDRRDRGDPPGGERQHRCNAPLPDPISFVDLPGRPFGVVPTHDGCWVFVSVSTRASEGLALLRRERGRASIERVFPLTDSPAGMVLTHDGKLLAGAIGDGVLFLDVGRMLEGAGDPVLGHIPSGPGSVYVNVTPDDSLLFVSDEWAESVTVIDLVRARAGGFGADAVVGRIPVGIAPIAVAISPDGRWLYSTSEVAPDAWGWPVACKDEGSTDPQLVAPEGAIVVADVRKARVDPAGSVVSRLPAGCSPVRAVLSPDGEVLFVTARNSDALVAFDASRLVAHPSRALLGKVPVGPSPVGVAVFGHGRRVAVANSNRFAPDPFQPQTLTIVDATRLEAGSGAVMATLPAGAFPRELAVSPDGRTLFAGNFFSRTLELVDLRPFLGRGDDGEEDAEE